MTLDHLLDVDASADANQLWRAYQRARAAWPRCWAWLQGSNVAGLAQDYQVLRDPASRAHDDQKLAAMLSIYGVAPGHRSPPTAPETRVEPRISGKAINGRRAL